jgi:septal ring factor EnvC (AmiA/AmiB activator)
LREVCHFISNLFVCLFVFLFVCLNARIQDGKHSQEIAQFQTELAEARTQLQLLQKKLDEQMSQQPTGSQEVTARPCFPTAQTEYMLFKCNTEGWIEIP